MLGAEDFRRLVEDVSQLVDLAGVAVIVVGLLLATGRYLSGLRESDAFRRFRQHVGKAILLGLEFLVAADIIRTVAVTPTFEGVGVLAIIVLIRTFLSFTLEVELEGRWPWERARAAFQGTAARP